MPTCLVLLCGVGSWLLRSPKCFDPCFSVVFLLRPSRCWLWLAGDEGLCLPAVGVSCFVVLVSYLCLLLVLS